MIPQIDDESCGARKIPVIQPQFEIHRDSNMDRIKLLLIAMLIIPLSSLADKLNSDEQAVWQLEEAYWQYVMANDTKAYRSLWDDRFVGWPGFSRAPLGKASIHEWIAQYHDDDADYFDYELTIGSVRDYGDVVAAHYLVQYFMRSVETSEKIGNGVTSRITHTWQRRGDTWQIVSGMSGTLIAAEVAE